MTFHMNRLASGSIPVEGSSRKTMGGLPIMAMATESFLLLPPLNYPDWMCSNLRRSISLSFLITNSSFLSIGIPFTSEKSSKCSLTVRFSRRASN